MGVYEAKVKAHPISAGNDTHRRIRHDRVDWCGKLTIPYEGRVRHIGMGAPFKGLRVVMLVADAEVRVPSTGGDRSAP